MGEAAETEEVLFVGGPYDSRRLPVRKGTTVQVYRTSPYFPGFYVYNREDDSGGEPRFVFAGTSYMRESVTGEPIRMEWEPNEPNEPKGVAR